MKWSYLLRTVASWVANPQNGSVMNCNNPDQILSTNRILVTLIRPFSIRTLLAFKVVKKPSHIGSKNDDGMCVQSCPALSNNMDNSPAGSSCPFQARSWWSRLPFPPPEDLPNPGMESVSLGQT